MPDKKLTDAEIVKALECCKYEYDTKCELCCYNFYSRTGCRSELRRNALDLINRLQAENERKDKIYIDLLKTSSERAVIISELQAEIERLKEDLKEIGAEYERFDDTVTNGAEVCYYCHAKYDEKIKQTKAEAYKEFWNCRPPRLEEKSVSNEEYNKGWNACLDEFWNARNNLLKELVGEDNITKECEYNAGN